EWHGFEDENKEDDSEDDVTRLMGPESDISDSSDDEDDVTTGSLIKKLDGLDVKTEEGLSKKAKLFFDQDIFAGIADEEGESDEEEEEEKEETKDAASETEEGEESEEVVDSESGEEEDENSDESDDDDAIEVVKTKDSEWDSQAADPMKNGRIGKFRRL